MSRVLLPRCVWLLLGIPLAACPPRPDPLPQPDLSNLPVAVAGGIEAAFQTARDEPSAETLGQYGETLHTFGFKEEAAGCYSQAAALEPENFRWPYLRGLALAARDPAEALRSFEIARDLDAEYAVLHFHVASLLQELGRDDEARQSLERAIALEDGHVPSRMMLGRMALSEADPDQALAHFQRALEASPEHPEVHECMAQVMFRLGRADEAAVHAKIARDRPQFVHVEDPRGALRKKAISHQDFNSRGLSRLRAGETDEALKDFKRSIELNPEYSIAWYNVGRLHADLGEYDQAEAPLRECLRLHPTHTQARGTLVDLLVTTDRSGEAMQLLDQWLAESMDAPLARRAARLALQNEQPQRAAQILERLGAAAADDAATANAVADLWIEIGRPVAAVQILEESMRRRPDDAGTAQRLGMQCGRVGQFEAAVDWFRRVYELRPDDTNAVGNLATACRIAALRLETLQPRRAHDLWEEAVRLRPDWVPGLRGAAWLFATSPDESARDPERAVTLATRAIEHGGRTAALLDVLAAAHANAGQYETAVSVAQEALAQTREKEVGLQRRIQRRLELYRSGQPFRSTAAPDDSE